MAVQARSAPRPFTHWPERIGRPESTSGFPRVCRPAVRGGAQFYRRALFYRGNFGRAGQRRASPRARARVLRPPKTLASFLGVRVVRFAPSRTGASEPGRGCSIVLEQRGRTNVAGRRVVALVAKMLLDLMPGRAADRRRGREP